MLNFNKFQNKSLNTAGKALICSNNIKGINCNILQNAGIKLVQNTKVHRCAQKQLTNTTIMYMIIS